MTKSPIRLRWAVACLSHLQDGDPLTDRKSELSEMTHIPWFAQCLALARGLIKIICYFYDLVKLVRKHAPTRTARESWLRTSDYKGHALYLQKSAAPMQISCLEHRDNAFCSLAEVVPPTGRIH